MSTTGGWADTNSKEIVMDAWLDVDALDREMAAYLAACDQELRLYLAVCARETNR